MGHAGVRDRWHRRGRLLYESHGAQWIDEDAPVEHYPNAQDNYSAEANAREGVVLRFGFFYGPGARHSEQMLALARRHIAVQLGPPEAYLSVIHIADAGSAVVAALKAEPGTYHVVDDEPLTPRAFTDAMTTELR
ncbi:hypothetical protein GCM10022222_30090 [Amycolatopsis ultiminotia]|uniref:Uncharacterized protein n=1 Tax=Amycolatopsis ultiminotia TaxID=543629 RepID=A0ABP6W0E7_9PSEU